MDNFRDSYFQVDWDLTSKRLKGTYWGKQYDTGRGFAVTVINGGQVVAPTTEVLRLKWEKPDNTTGYVTATIVDGKFIVENIDQMFTVHGSVRADFELSVGGKFVASITFYVSVEKAVAVDAIESSSEFTALQTAIATVDGLDAEMASLQTDFDTFTGNIINIPSTIYTSDTQPPNPSEGDIWFKIISSVPEIPVSDYFFRFDASELNLADGAKVAQWDDLSGNGNDLTQRVESNQPTFLKTGLSGKPTVKFDGTSLIKTGFALPNTGEFTIFTVCEFDQYTNSGTIMGIGKDGYEARALYLRVSGSGQALEISLNHTQVSHSKIDGSPYYIHTSHYDGTQVNAYKFGVLAFFNSPYANPIGEHNALTLGLSLHNAEPFYGRISESIYFDRSLTEEERVSCETYLMQKWGI